MAQEETDPGSGAILSDLGLSGRDGPIAIGEILDAAERVVDDLEAAAQIRVSGGVAELLMTANRPAEALDWLARGAEYARPGESGVAAGVLAALELRRADVLIQLGRAEEAREAARSGRDAADDRDTRVAAIALMAKAYAAEGRMREAQDILRGIEVVAADGTLAPDTLYHMYTTAVALEEDATARRMRARLLEGYPDSPEALLLDEGGEPPVFTALSPTTIAAGGLSRIADSPESAEAETATPTGGDSSVDTSPGAASDASEEASWSGADSEEGGGRNYVQVGSFRDSENAEYMRRDMEQMGFTAEVRSKKLSASTYYQVLIPVRVGPDETTQEAIQQVVVKLKERGYEGFLVRE